MKTIKPQKLGLLTKVFDDAGSSYLVVTALAFFPFDAPKSLSLETNLWKLVGTELGQTPLDLCMPKPRGEVLVTGRGYPRGGPHPACSVRVKLGTVDKTLWVVGNRRWKLGAPSDAEPFTEMPITWENAFGGVGFAQNPVGKGFSPIKGDHHPLPNIEDPKHLLRSPKDRPAPAGFGAYDFAWPQRSSKMGTYDDAWLKQRYPGFAADFDLGFFNAAPEDQWIEGYFQGDEAFSIENMHPDKALLESHLPGLKARVFINQKTPEGETFREVKTRIDTVHLFPHVERGLLIFRGMVKILEDDAADVLQIVGAVEEADDPRPVEHYQTILAQRLDKKKAYLYLLRDRDLLPPRLAGDPQRPDDRSDVKDLMASEKLHQRNVRRRIAAELEKTREQLRTQGIDPDAHVPADPKESAPIDLDNLADLTMTLEADFDARMKSATEERAAAEKKARAACEENGIDYDKVVAEKKRQAGGPPKMTAKGELAKLRAEVESAKKAGIELPHVEAQLADPALEAKLKKAEDALREAYRLFGHHMDPAYPLLGAEGDRARADVVAALAAGESLAGRDLTGVDLSNLDLHGAGLQMAFLEAANLSGSNLTGADLTGAMAARANLTGADLGGAKLRGANLGGARMSGAKAHGADLTGAILAKVDLAGADFAGARLVGADLAGALFAETNFRDVKAAGVSFLKSDLTGLRLTGADLTKCNFLMTSVAGVDFTGATLESAVFLSADGSGAVFRDATLTNLRIVKGSTFDGADFSGAKLDRANLRGTRLAAANFAGASLVSADLSECYLRGAELGRIVAREALFLKADLTGANLSHADLMLSILQKARLVGASFAGANLFRADLFRVEVDGATSMKDANLTQIRFMEPKRDHAKG